MLPFREIQKRFLSTLSKANKNFEKILIANRGEIALRIMRTAKKMDIKCVAIFSEADKHSQHVKMADEAILIGPAPSSESYLKIENVLNAMMRTGSEAVHPGYGFLSENYKFAEAVEKYGLNFIGPPSGAIKSMGSKSESKTIMTNAGVPCIPGYHGNNQDHEFLSIKAEEIGYPIMIKAVLGGGGKGMRIAYNSNEFKEMLQSAKRESLKSFGDDNVLLEKYIQRSRHVEVQIFADKHGNCVYLFERDCSIQRRNQKIIEEAPAYGLTEEIRRKLGETAVKAAKAVNYVGPGTVEFIYDLSDDSFYFMEMNTRLQVEHPVTEMITGQDLVEMQINAAAGKPLLLKQEDLLIDGHAIEARIYAEIPEKNFVPDTGTLNLFKFPENSSNLRVETGVQKDDEISIFYDPMIAKVIAYGQDRKEAIKKLDSALSDIMIDGVSTNVEFIRRVIQTEDFKQFQIDTNFIKDHHDYLFSPLKPTNELILMAAIIKILRIHDARNHDVFQYFRLGSNGKESVHLRFGDDNYDLIIEKIDNNLIRSKLLSGQVLDASIIQFKEDLLRVVINEEMHVIRYFVSENRISVWSKHLGEFIFNFESLDQRNSSAEEKVKDSNGRIVSSMPCKINQIMVRPGERVNVGSPLCVTEAMKMELVIKSNVDGIVKSLHFKEGDIVPDKSLLMEIDVGSDK